MIDGQSWSLLQTFVKPFVLIQIVTTEHANFCNFEKKKKKKNEWFKYKHGGFQLRSLSDRHVFYSILRHLSPWYRTNTRHALSL